jgi:O-antigen/teichoic acid export membrane protein
MLGGVPATFVIYLPWLLLMSLAAQIAGIQLVILRFADRAALFAWLSFIDLAAAALSSALFIVVLDMGIEGALAGIIIGKLLVIVIAWPASFNTPGCAKTNATTIRGMLAYAIPTMPSVLLNWLQTTGNRALMAFFFAFSAVAVAGVAIKVAALYAFLAYTFRLAWEPYSFQKLADVANDRAIYQRALIWYLATMFPAATFVSAAAPIIVRILAPAAYAPAAAVVGFFTMAQFWLGAITVLAIGIHGARLTSRLSLVYGIGSVANVLLLALLARYIGILAVGIGALASGILTAGLAAHFSRKHFAVWFSPSLLVSMMLLSAATATGFYFIYSSTWMGEWGYGAAPVAILIALTVMLITARLIDRCSGCYGLAAMWADIRITLRRTND